jgi:hypothetical protein
MVPSLLATLLNCRSYRPFIIEQGSDYDRGQRMDKGFEPLLARLRAYYFLKYPAISFLLPSRPIFFYLSPRLCLLIELRSTVPLLLFGLGADNCPCCNSVKGAARHPSCGELPITVVARSKAQNGFGRLNAWIVGSNPNEGMGVCVRLFCVCSSIAKG